MINNDKRLKTIKNDNINGSEQQKTAL